MVIHVNKQDVILTFLSVFAENELFFRKSPFWKYGTRWNFGHWSIEGNKDKSIDHNVELQLPFLPFYCCCQFLNGKAGLPLLKEGIYGLNLTHRNGHSCARDVETPLILPSWISEIVLKFNSVHEAVSLFRFDV